MPAIVLSGFIVRETDLAVAFVKESDAKVENIRPIELPRKKISSMAERDAMSKNIQCDRYGQRVGTPYTVTVDSDFLDRIKVTY